jgi:hypothetical protein
MGVKRNTIVYKRRICFNQMPIIDSSKSKLGNLKEVRKEMELKGL